MLTLPRIWGGGARVAARPVDRLGQLRFANGALRDARGEIVTLRGVSLFWSQWYPTFFNARLVEWLASDWRVDILRIPVAGVAPGYLSDPAGELAKARVVIDAAIEAGIYVLVDWHAHDLHTGPATELFGAIASSYGDSPNLLYEPWNEPSPCYRWEEIAEHYERVLDTIRTHAPRAPAILGTPHYCIDLEAAANAPLDRSNIAYALHFYAATHREGLRLRVEQARASGISVFASEWGLGDATGGGTPDHAEAERWLDFLNRSHISHVNWSVCDKLEACAALQPGASPHGGWKRGQLSASGRFVRDYLRTRRG